LQEQDGDVTGRYVVAADGDLGQYQEEDHADAVVEEGFTGDLGFKASWDLGAFEDSQDSHGIGGGDERAEQQAPNEGQGQVAEVEDEVDQRSEENGG
jgi:hypothetical protein